MRVAVALAAIVLCGLIAWIGTAYLGDGIREDDIEMVEMSYTDLTAIAQGELSHPIDGDLIVFRPPEHEVFQAIRQNPRGWRPLIERMVQDPDVSLEAKFGTIGALGDLPPRERAAFLEVLLDEADKDPRAITLADFFAGNLWRMSSYLRASLIAGDSLFEHSRVDEVRAALRRLWAHPALDPASRQEGTLLYEMFGPRDG